MELNNKYINFNKQILCYKKVIRLLNLEKVSLKSNHVLNLFLFQ